MTCAPPLCESNDSTGGLRLPRKRAEKDRLFCFCAILVRLSVLSQRRDVERATATLCCTKLRALKLAGCCPRLHQIATQTRRAAHRPPVWDSATAQPQSQRNHVATRSCTVAQKCNRCHAGAARWHH